MVPIGVVLTLMVKVMVLGLSWSMAAGGGPGGDLGLGDLDLLLCSWPCGQTALLRMR